MVLRPGSICVPPATFAWSTAGVDRPSKYPKIKHRMLSKSDVSGGWDT